MVRAIWRVFEEASPEERETMVTFRWDFVLRTDEGHSEFWGIPGLTRSEVVELYSNLLAEAVGEETLTSEDVERHFTWNRIVEHDIAWIRLRSSFMVVGSGRSSDWSGWQNIQPVSGVVGWTVFSRFTMLV